MGDGPRLARVQKPRRHLHDVLDLNQPCVSIRPLERVSDYARACLIRHKPVMKFDNECHMTAGHYTGKLRVLSVTEYAPTHRLWLQPARRQPGTCRDIAGRLPWRWQSCARTAQWRLAAHEHVFWFTNTAFSLCDHGQSVCTDTLPMGWCVKPTYVEHIQIVET